MDGDEQQSENQIPPPQGYNRSPAETNQAKTLQSDNGAVMRIRIIRSF